jgi:beta-N-acetylhexosaminidase
LSSKLSFANDAEEALAVIFSLAGPTITDQEKALFEKADPFGFILFARNCETPEQVARLTTDLKQLVGRNCPILIDQEGGRVQRLKPPIWRAYPAAETFGARAEVDLDFALDDLRFNTLQLSDELRDLGINVNCTPVLDVSQPETHDVIGDRAFSDNPEIVSRLGLCVARNSLAAGIVPVIKHMPGHGRATADSHKVLPHVSASLQELEKTDFLPFRDIASSDVGLSVWGMPTPVLYTALDPDHAACASSKILKDVIRGHMNFQGVLVSDALDMEGFAAYGDAAGRVNAVLKAGCDLALHCTGVLAEMEKIAKSVPKITEKGLERLQKAAEFRKLAA